MTHDQQPRRRIRVLMVMPSYYPVVGGMEIQVERLIPHLREHGIDVSVLTRRSEGTVRLEQHNGVEIRRVTVSGGPGVRSIAFTARGIADIVRNRRGIDILHAHSIMSPSTIAVVAGVLLRKPRIVTLHANYEFEHLLRKPFGDQRLRLLRRSISRFVCINDDIEQLLLQHDVSSERIVSVPNGIDTLHFNRAVGNKRIALREALALPTDQSIVIFTGRLHPVKRLDVLLHAWSGVEGARLVILGDGTERESLMALVRNLNLDGHVEFRGMVSDVVDYLRAADVFVLPSASEGLSVALLEAMAAGLVPVSTAVGGAVDIIRNEENGLLVQPGDVVGLQAALSRALSTDGWRSGAALKARETVVAGFDLRSVAAQLAGVYHGLTAERDT